MVIELPEGNEETAPGGYSTAPAIAAARGLLKDPLDTEDSIWMLFGAFALMAIAALGLAVAVVMGPPQFG
jgi:hypothetical protein